MSADFTTGLLGILAAILDPGTVSVTCGAILDLSTLLLLEEKVNLNHSAAFAFFQNVPSIVFF